MDLAVVLVDYKERWRQGERSNNSSEVPHCLSRLYPIQNPSFSSSLTEYFLFPFTPHVTIFPPLKNSHNFYRLVDIFKQTHLKKWYFSAGIKSKESLQVGDEVYFSIKYRFGKLTFVDFSNLFIMISTKSSCLPPKPSRAALENSDLTQKMRALVQNSCKLFPLCLLTGANCIIGIVQS